MGTKGNFEKNETMQRVFKIFTGDIGFRTCAGVAEMCDIDKEIKL